MPTMHTASHADNHASWTPPWEGPPLPWLSSCPGIQLPPSTLSHQAKWHQLQQASPLSAQTATRRLPPTKSPATPPVLSPQQVVSDPRTSPTSPLPFMFSRQHLTNFGSPQLALDQFMAWIRHQAPESFWSTLRVLDLRHHHLTSVHHLDSFFPALESLDLSHNEIQSITCLPSTLRVLKASSNRLTDIDGIRSLSKLEYLDVSGNAIGSFKGIGPWYHCKTLVANNNKIDSFDPFQALKGLVTLRLSSNNIDELNLEALYQLETLDVSYNRISMVNGLHHLHSLQYLNLDNNDIRMIAFDMPMRGLQTLRLNHNRLAYFDARSVPQARVLYLDNNQLTHVDGLDQLVDLIVLSIRDQSGQPLRIGLNDLHSTTKLYLSSLPIKQLYGLPCFESLTYLEICATQLEELPDDFATRLPRLNVLYLNDNFLTHIAPLRHCRSLQKLVLLNNRLKDLGALVKTLHCLSHLEILDLRQNPLTHKLYPPIDYPKTYRSKHNRLQLLCRYLAPEHDTHWPSSDQHFYDRLPSHWRYRRKLYRAMLVRACKRLTQLDQSPVTSTELDSCQELLATLSSSN
ncbi:L domain-like protein [Hesseltinella vesiculosa]|uniref:L domain-like protein n=1 Tax=Hesseltinella vesiculosa TaxID=101127 RepID=A0A1X2GCA0_9FUNG|nr:L domain-like protein [Hesseltinella vesiculosa]